MAMPTMGLVRASAGPENAIKPSTMADRTNLRNVMLHSHVFSVSRPVVAIFSWHRRVPAHR
jgi:Tfp pilus assembly ATPase PilU